MNEIINRTDITNTYAGAEVESLRVAVKRVWGLHTPVRLGCIIHYGRTDCGCEPRQACHGCGQAYPCSTLLALDGGGSDD